MEGVQIIVSDDVVKHEIKRLLQEEIENQKVWWHLDDVRISTGKSTNWIKDNILYQPKFKQELEKFTHFPSNSGDKWCFLAQPMYDFLSKHFPDFFEKVG
ncbi:DUF771 domain-containing protein [Sporolactobacillus sp. KGMB 08714]|uniref:DUF771 domain-containing protein n=1 Tax=Sporolactobacillus sp. KGMB 08714 TaxID=3064704 RepID=UPI002FBEEC57